MNESLRVIVSQGLSFGLQMFFLLLAARVLGAEGQGMYGVARTCAYLIETLMWFGLTSGATHLIASNFERYHRPFLALATAYLAGFSLISLPIVFWVLPSFGIAAYTAALALLWVITIAVTQLFFKIFIGQQRYSLYNRIYLLTSAAAFLPLLWLLRIGDITFHGVIWCNILANGLGIAFSVIAHRSHLSRSRILGGISRDRIADFFSVGIKGYVSSVAFLLLYRADFFIVGHLAPKALGAYTIAVFIGEAVQKIPDWLGLMLVPKVSVGEDHDGHLTRRYLFLSWCFVAAVAAVLGAAALAGFRYLELLLGGDYHDVEFYVLALMPKALLHCVIAIYGARLAGHAYTLYHPLAGVVAFVVLMIVDMALFQFLGIAAAIVGITTAYAVAGLILAIGARRQSRNPRTLSECVQT